MTPSMGAQNPQGPGVRGSRTRERELENLEPNLPVQDRLKVPLLKSMYRQGNTMIDEGQNSQDPSKVKYGVQRINEANERLERLESLNLQKQSGREGNDGRQGRRGDR